MVRFGLRQHTSEASVKVSSRSNLFWLFQRRFSVCFLWLGLVWLSLLRFGSREHPSEASVKVSSRLVLAQYALSSQRVETFNVDCNVSNLMKLKNAKTCRN